MLTIACVWVGNKYGSEYVTKLRDMVARNLDGAYRFVCFTDHPEWLVGVTCIDIRALRLPGWWAKMAIFNPDLRPDGRCIYFDLDTVITGDLGPLADWGGEFGICENFTKLAGHHDWPCDYGSCVMSLARGFGRRIYDEFMRDPAGWMQRCPKGDQQAIEMLYPGAEYLQDVMPKGYFVGRRQFTNKRPKNAAVMIFAGKHKPHNTPHKWLREAWG